jgi:hypothetical protein
MFGFGKKKASKSRIFALTFFPDGSVIDQTWFNPDARGLPRPAEGKTEAAFRIDGEACRLDATVRGGNAILSIWHGTRIVTSSLFVSGAQPAADDDLIALYLETMRRTELVRQLTAGNTAPFSDVETALERPLLITLLTPAPSRELTDKIVDRQRAWVAALLDD